jgi:hypothetical protein
MTPQEKAIELVEKYAYHLWIDGVCDYDKAKQCALIAVDEILELKETQEEYQIQYTNGEWSREIGYKYSKYWLEVKTEIEKL